jgi:type II secretory pathway pseudopilin PulG
LAKAEHELPSFGRAAIAFAGGIAMSGAFLVLLIAAFIEKKPGAIGFWTLMTAGEIVAWRVKWMALPIGIAVIWSGVRIVRSIKQNPSRFIGLRGARIGLAAACVVTLMVAGLIAITIPERMRQRQESIYAAQHARGYTFSRALLEYRELHGTYPMDRDKWMDALRTLPDPDGSIAEALRFVDPNGYQATAQVAAASTKSKPLVTSGLALRKASSGNNPEPASVSFTSYELRLPSEHRLLASDDDFVLRDGVIVKVNPTSSSAAAPRIP